MLLIIGSLLVILLFYASIDDLKSKEMDDTAKAIWALIILIVPILGPITYFMINFNSKESSI